MGVFLRVSVGMCVSVGYMVVYVGCGSVLDVVCVSMCVCVRAYESCKFISVCVIINNNIDTIILHVDV